MTISNPKLEKYIQENSVPSVYNRAISIFVESFSITENGNRVTGKVTGSTGKNYTINIEGIKGENKIKSSCSCPYNWENVCKHTIALVFEINDYLDSKYETSMSKKPKERYSSLDTYKMEFAGVDSFKTKELEKHTRNASYPAYSEYDIYINEKKKNYIEIIVDEYYNPLAINITRKKDHIYLACTCDKVKSSLCSHQVRVLKYIKKNIPNLFLSDKEMDLFKDNLLIEYGFSLDDDSYKEDFELGT